MSDEDALLAAISADPEDDTVRLAYADWLDENADALPDADLARVRAEFIRVQTERLRCPYWLPEHTLRYRELCLRERAIEEHYRAALLGPAAGANGVEVRFSRGFPILRTPVGTFLAHAERFAQVRPPELTVTRVADQWYDLVTHPRLPLITHLRMTQLQNWSNYPWALAAGVVGQMSELARGNRVRGLDMSRCHFGDGGVSQLADHADVWRFLEDLDLSHNDMQFTGLMDLLLSPLPVALRRLNLCSNPLTERAAQALAERWPPTDALKWIRLVNTNISLTGQQVLRARFGDKVEFE